MTITKISAVLSTKSSADDDLEDKVSLTLTQDTPAVCHKTARFCWFYIVIIQYGLTKR